MITTTESIMKINISKAGIAVLILAFSAAPTAVLADSGFYIGGAAGNATLEVAFSGTEFPELPTSFDEDDTAYKVFAGYNLDLPLVNLGVEAGYVDFGAPRIDTFLGPVEFDPTGINLWGIAGLDVGPIDVFAKLGYVFWDVEVSALDDNFSDDGADLGYGLGVGFGIAGIKVRGEYEVYDLDDTDLSMVSIGILYQFD
jgi:hypothetical protein